MLNFIVKAAKILVIFLLVLDLFFWLAAHASGHKIPLETNWYFGLSSALLAVVAFLLHKKSYKMKS
jgi:hypothetical protein